MKNISFALVVPFFALACGKKAAPGASQPVDESKLSKRFHLFIFAQLNHSWGRMRYRAKFPSLSIKISAFKI